MCQEFWEDMGRGFEVLQEHPVVSGESLYAWAAAVSTAPVAETVALDECVPGDMRYSQNTGNKFSINYGRSTEPLAQPFLGRVLPEYHHLLPGVGKAVWYNLFFIKAEIYVHVSPCNPDEAFTGKGRFDDLTGVAAEFYAEAKRIQKVEPEELRRIRLGQVGETGNYGQYFSAWDFANGMLRDYIMYTAFHWIKFVDMLPHEGLVAVIDTQDEPYSGYLGFSGLKTLRAFALKLREAVRGTKDKDELRAMLRVFVMYGNRLCAWSYHYFPWHIGVFFGRQGEGHEHPGRFLLSKDKPEYPQDKFAEMMLVRNLGADTGEAGRENTVQNTLKGLEDRLRALEVKSGAKPEDK